MEAIAIIALITSVIALIVALFAAVLAYNIGHPKPTHIVTGQYGTGPSGQAMVITPIQETFGGFSGFSPQPVPVHPDSDNSTNSDIQDDSDD